MSQVTIKKIFPDQAQEWLDKRRANNRNINMETAKMYAKSMVEGKFPLNGQSIVFNTEGSLIDGQHRLTACTIAKVPFESVVVEGIENSAFSTLDTGKNRSLNDTLQIEGFIHGPVKLMSSMGSIIRLVYLHKYYGYAVPTKVSSRIVTPQVALEFLQGSQERATLFQKAACFAGPNARKNTFWTPAVAGYMYFCTHVVDPKIADEFFKNMAGIVDGRPNNPAQMLSEKIAAKDNNKFRMATKVAIGLSIKAWNNFRDHTPMQKLDLKVGKKNRSEYPVFSGLDVNKL
jgi:hypothetical protein